MKLKSVKSRNSAVQQILIKKSLWKLLKGQSSSSQMSAFLVDGKLITETNLIRKMWADLLKPWIPRLVIRTLMIIFVLMLLQMFKTSLIRLWKTHLEFFVHPWNMMRLLLFAPA